MSGFRSSISREGRAPETVIVSIMSSGSSGRAMLLIGKAWAVWFKRFGMIYRRIMWRSGSLSLQINRGYQSSEGLTTREDNLDELLSRARMLWFDSRAFGARIYHFKENPATPPNVPDTLYHHPHLWSSSCAVHAEMQFVPIL